MLTNQSFLLYVAITIVSFLIVLVIVSVPVWISARVLSAKQGKFSREMLVTHAGPLTYTVVYFISKKIVDIIILSLEQIFSIFDKYDRYYPCLCWLDLCVYRRI
jgi:hypothetical protein